MRNLDAYAGALLVVVALGALVLWLLALCRSAGRPRPSLPGSLARDVAGFDADLEAQRDPGLGEVWHRRYEGGPS